MKSSSISTERLALFILFKSDFIVINVSASLWVISIDIINAPLRLLPCFKEAVVVLNNSINGTIPSDSYLFLIKQPLGLILDNETPCPPSAL